MTEDPKLAEQAAEMFCTTKQADAAFEQAKNYWNGLVNISFETGNPKEDSYLKWICFQPVLRRITDVRFCRTMIMAEAAGAGGSVAGLSLPSDSRPEGSSLHDFKQLCGCPF